MNELEEDKIIIDIDNKINSNIITQEDAKKQLDTFMSFYRNWKRI